MARKFAAMLFALLALAAAGMGIYAALSNMDAEPVLVEVPEEARELALTMMEDLCRGDYPAVSQVLYGQPDLGLDRDPADAVGVLIFEAYQDSLQYELLRDCYVTDQGIAMDVAVTFLDVSSVTANLRQRTATLLEAHVAKTEDASVIYAAGGEYREEFVMEVLYEAAVQALSEDGKTLRTELTLECVFENGQWWIVPTDGLMKIIGCGIYR